MVSLFHPPSPFWPSSFPLPTYFRPTISSHSFLICLVLFSFTGSYFLDHRSLFFVLWKAESEGLIDRGVLSVRPVGVLIVLGLGATIWLWGSWIWSRWGSRPVMFWQMHHLQILLLVLCIIDFFPLIRFVFVADGDFSICCAGFVFGGLLIWISFIIVYPLNVLIGCSFYFSRLGPLLLFHIFWLFGVLVVLSFSSGSPRRKLWSFSPTVLVGWVLLFEFEGQCIMTWCTILVIMLFFGGSLLG